MSASPKIYNVDFWRDGCTPVSPGCDNCPCHGPGLLPSFHGQAAARLNKINKHSFAIGGTPHLVLIQDDCDVWADHVEQSDYLTMVQAIEEAQAVDMVISTRYIIAMEHRAPAKWLNGKWPANLGLMVSVSNQREAEKDIALLLAMKTKHNIPWVGVRLEPLLSEVNLRKLTLQELAHPRKRGRQTLDALTGEVSGITDPKFAPKSRFGKLDWVTVKGETGDTARPLHPAWIGRLERDCDVTKTPLHFRGWGEWVPHSEMMPYQTAEVFKPGSKKPDEMLMYRHGGTTSDHPDELMEFYRLGPLESGGMYRGRHVHGIPAFPRREIQKVAA